jgi:hypothetical protein
MDVSYDDEGIEHVVADLNRMKQGIVHTRNRSTQAHCHSTCKLDNKRRQIHVKEKWGTQDYCIHGCLYRTSDIVSA